MIFRHLSRLLAIAACLLPLQSAADDIPVAAASSLMIVLEEIAGLFQRETGHTVKLSFGSSGTLARQIIYGAPFELFLSADEQSVSLLNERGLTDGRGNVYGIGRLALFVPRHSAVKPAADLSTLAGSVRMGVLTRFAMANPEHAAYGMQAKQALQNAGAWDAIEPRLVLGKNAAQAMQFALSGAVDAALLPYSLALLPAVANNGRWILVSETLYTPLRQRMVLRRNAGAAAREFHHYLVGEEARAVFARYGLGPAAGPDERMADRAP